MGYGTVTISSSDSMGAALNSGSFAIQYYAGSSGNMVLPPGAACKEAIAMAAGRAVTYVQADKLCQGIQGIRIIIGDTAESVHSGFEMVNLNFGCNGTQSSVVSVFNLGAPVLA